MALHLRTLFFMVATLCAEKTNQSSSEIFETETGEKCEPVDKLDWRYSKLGFICWGLYGMEFLSGRNVTRVNGIETTAAKFFGMLKSVTATPSLY